MKILNYGSLNIDYVYHVSHFVNPGETITSTDMNVFPGGKGLNQSVALAKAGAKVFHAGTIGKEGLFLKKTLEANGVDCRYIETLDAVTGHANIQVNKQGENAIVLFKGSNYGNSKEGMDQVLNEFSTGDVLLLQNEINDIEYLIQLARKHDMRIMLNPSPITDEILQMDFSAVTWLILNEVEGEALSGKNGSQEILEELSQKYPDTAIILTLGKKGSIYKRREQYYIQPCIPCNAVDTTAAGDTFTGFFLGGISRGLQPENAMKEAAIAASIAVSRNGGSSSIPSLEEVLAIE